MAKKKKQTKEIVDPSIEVQQESEIMHVPDLDKSVFKTNRTRVFYGDPGADELTKHFENFCIDFLDSFNDEESEMLKILPKSNLVEVLALVKDHIEFRAKLDWAKEQRYEFIDQHNDRTANILIGNPDVSFFKEELAKFQ